MATPRQRGWRPHRLLLDRVVPTLVALTALAEQLPGAEIVGGLGYFAANSQRLRNRIPQRPDKQLPAGLHYRKGVGLLAATSGLIDLPEGAIPGLPPDVVTALGDHSSAVALAVAATTGSIVQFVQGRNARRASNATSAVRRGRWHGAGDTGAPGSRQSPPTTDLRVQIVPPSDGNDTRGGRSH